MPRSPATYGWSAILAIVREHRRELVVAHIVAVLAAASVPIPLLMPLMVDEVLLLMHWQLALFILLLNPAVIWFTTVLGKRVKYLKKRENSAFELFQQALTETLDAIQHIRTHTAAFSWQSDAASRLSFMVFLFGFDVFRALSMLMVVFSDLTIGQMMAVFGYVFDNGQIIEEGAHEELIRGDGLYARLYGALQH